MELDLSQPSDIQTTMCKNEEEFCLRWKDFQANSSNNFAKIRDQGQFFDCTLATDDGLLRAHRIILAASSEFFRDILSKEIMAVHPNPVIYLSGVSERYLKSMMDFMYNGEVTVAHGELMRFLRVAGTLKIKGLMDGPNVSPAMKKPAKRKSSALTPSDDSNKRSKVKQAPHDTNLEAEEIEEDKVVNETAFLGSNDNELVQEDTLKEEEYESYDNDKSPGISKGDDEIDQSDYSDCKGKEDDSWRFTDHEDIDDPQGNEESGADTPGSKSGPPKKNPMSNTSKSISKVGRCKYLPGIGTRYEGDGTKLSYTEKREKIAKRLKEGKRTAEIMEELLCSEKLVYRVKKMLKDNVSLRAWY